MDISCLIHPSLLDWRAGMEPKYHIEQDETVDIIQFKHLISQKGLVQVPKSESRSLFAKGLQRRTIVGIDVSEDNLKSRGEESAGIYHTQKLPQYVWDEEKHC